MALFLQPYLELPRKGIDKKTICLNGPSIHMRHQIHLEIETEETPSPNRQTEKETIPYWTEGDHTNKPSEAASERSNSKRSARTL